MRKRLKKALNIILLAILLVLAYNNFCYAGNIGNSPDAWIFGVIIYGPIVLIIFLLFCFVLSTTSEKNSNYSYNKRNKATTQKEQIYSLSEIVLYTIVICLSIYLVFINKNILLFFSIVLIISFILVCILLKNIFIEKKLDKQEDKSRTITKEKLEKNIAKIKNTIYIIFFMITCFGIFINVKATVTLLLLFIITSIAITQLENKKIATTIGLMFIFLSSLTVLFIN